MKINKTYAIVFIIFGIYSGTLPDVFAYVPPSFYVLKNLAKKHEKTDAVLFKHKISFYRKSGDLSKVFTENFFYSSKGYSITQILDDSQSAVKLPDGSSKFTRRWTGNKDNDSTRPISYDLLYLKDFNLSFNRFKELGLPLKSETELYNTRLPFAPKEVKPEKKPDLVKADAVENSKEAIDIQTPNVYESEPYITLSRFENKLAFVIGPADPQVMGLQLWVEKDSLFPLRALLSPYEYRTSGYQLYKNILYPRLIQILKDGILWAKVEVLEIKEGATETLLSSKSMASADGEAQDNLELYFKVFR